MLYMHYVYSLGTNHYFLLLNKSAMPLSHHDFAAFLPLPASPPVIIVTSITDLAAISFLAYALALS
jgi:hypothetical protein